MALEDRVEKIRTERLLAQKAISERTEPTPNTQTPLDPPQQLNHPKFLAGRDIIEAFSVNRVLATVAVKYWQCGRLAELDDGHEVGTELRLKLESHTYEPNPNHIPGHEVFRTVYPEKGLTGGKWVTVGEIGPAFFHRTYKYPEDALITVKTKQDTSPKNNPDSSSTGFPLNLYLLADIRIGNPLPVYHKRATFRSPNEVDNFEEFFAEYIVDQGLDSAPTIERCKGLTVPKDFQLGYVAGYLFKNGRIDEAITTMSYPKWVTRLNKI